MAMQILSMNLRSKSLHTAREVLTSFMTDAIHPAHIYSKLLRKATPGSFPGSVKYVQTMLFPEDTKDLVPDSDPLRDEDVIALCNFFDRSKKLVVLTGAGISTECGIPDYRSPNGAYSTGYEPMTHQKFMSSIRARKQYWIYRYAMWRKFKEAKPGPAHIALASLEKANRISLIITQNIDGLHHCAGSNACDIHGTLHIVTCMNCGFCFPRDEFEDKINAINPEFRDNMNALNPEQEKIASKTDLIEHALFYWGDYLQLPTCSKCTGVLKPDVVLVGGYIPDDRYDMAMEAAEGCESFLVLGTSLTESIPIELTKAAKDADATIAIVNIGKTSCDDIAHLKIEARVGEILPRVLEKLGVPDIGDLEQDKY